MPQRTAPRTAGLREAVQARRHTGGPARSESLVERRIRQAQEQGLFDDLPGRGRPLDLHDDNPFEDPDWRLAYRILRNAGFAPRWIELGRELEADWELCQQSLGDYERRVRAAAAALGRRYAPAAELAALRGAHATFVAATVERIRAYNAKVDLFNLQVPIFTLQRPRQRLEPVLGWLAALEPARLYGGGAVV